MLGPQGSSVFGRRGSHGALYSEIRTVCSNIATLENRPLPTEALEHVVRESAGNMRLAILRCEALSVCSKYFQDGHTLSLPLSDVIATDWEHTIEEMSSLIASSKQHVPTLLEARKLAYDLLAKCIDPSCIIKVSPPSTACASALR